MMQVRSWFWATVAFAAELATLAALAVAGWSLPAPTPVRLLAAIGFPVVAAVLWGLFAAPRSVVGVPALAVVTKVLVHGAAVVAGCLSVDAALGSTTPFDPEIQKLRRQQGQMDVAATYLHLMKGSEIRASHQDSNHDPKVQDPYCLRCMPQVMGACLDHIRFAADIFLREVNAVTDNPLVILETGEVKSGGNFHAEPVAMAADALALAIAEIGNMSERRIAMLIDSKISGLPPFLVKDAGVNSGFMIAHVTAAALCSENKALAHPSSVDSIPTSANQEDHVSMATYAARRLGDMGDNTATIVGIELLAAAQGVDFHAPLKTSKSLQAAVKFLRAEVKHYDEDHYFAPDIRVATRLVNQGTFLPFVGRALLPSLYS